jgi:hypothetical protein
MLTHGMVKKMTTATTAPKASKVIVTAPKIATAWKALTATTAKNDSENILAIERLVKEMKASALSIRDIQAVIKDTKLGSSVVKISHVEGLSTWLDLRFKFDAFKALDLGSQLSKASNAYKLGAGYAQQLPTWEAVEKAVKAHNKNKREKSKDTQASEKSEPKTPKAKATNAGTLKEINAYFMALDLSTLSDSELDLIAEIHATIEGKVETMA